MRTKDLEPRPSTDLDSFRALACDRFPGFKVIAYDTGASPNWWLRHWPCRTALVLTGDESGRWGLHADKRFWGPFGAGSEEEYFDTNTTGATPHIALPPQIKPWFRQVAEEKKRKKKGKG